MDTVTPAPAGPDDLRVMLFATATAPKDIPVPGDFPLAMLPFGFCTLIESAIEGLANLGVRQLDLVISSQPEELRQLLGLGERWGVSLRWHLVKDAASPYGILCAMDLAPQQRVLLGQAGRLIDSSALSALLERNQIAALSDEHEGMRWAGWASLQASELLKRPPHCDESALGSFLCQSASPLLLIESQNWVSIESAPDLYQAQQRAMTDDALAQLPATWLRTPWGAYSPDAVVQDGARMARPTLVGPGCFVASGAKLGPGTVLTRDVIVSSGATVCRSVVFPDTFIGQQLELDQCLVNGPSVEHLGLGVRTVLPATDGLLLDLQPHGKGGASWLSRLLALLVCLLFLPWLALDAWLRHARGLPLRWHKRQSVIGRDSGTGEVRLQALRCPLTQGRRGSHLLAHYGAWLDVLQGNRNWFGVRPRNQSEWYALGRDWQLLLANTPVGCLHAPAWHDELGESLEAQAAADVYFAVRQSLGERLRILRVLLRRN